MNCSIFPRYMIFHSLRTIKNMVLIKDSNVTIVGKYWDSTIIPILIYPSTWTTGSINGLLNNGWGRAQTRQLKHRGSFIFGAPNTQSSQRVYVFNQRSHRQELAWLQADEQRRQASAKTDQCPILISSRLVSTSVSPCASRGKQLQMWSGNRLSRKFCQTFCTRKQEQGLPI